MKSRRVHLAIRVVLALAVVSLGLVLHNSFESGHCRCLEPSTKGNMHVVQLAVENFALQHDGQYPWTSEDVASALPNHGAQLKNAITGERLVVPVRRGDPIEGDPHAPGIVVVYRPSDTSYVIRGCGKSGGWLEARRTRVHF